MKNITTTLLLFCVCIANLHAQSLKGDHELLLGIGKVSGMDIIYTVGYNKDAAYRFRQYYPVYGLSYKYAINNSCSIGISLTQHSYKGWYDNTWTKKHIDESYDLVSACAEIKNYYPHANWRHFGLYYSFSLGIIILNPKGYLPSSNICPLGFRIGNTDGFFSEFSIGNKGLIHCGYSHRFHSSKNKF